VVWIPIGAWIGAAVLALVVLGFCGYEIIWKAKRLRSDVARLNESTARIAELQAQLAQTQERIAAVGRR
jgi:hypothetical protein